MKLFRRGYEVTLNRVHDTVNIREGDERLTLTVNGDALRMVAGLNRAQDKMKSLADDATDDQARECAEFFAAVIFGKDQAQKLMAFYADDPGSVISVCGQYFKDRLAGKISAAQKRMKNAETV